MNVGQTPVRTVEFEGEMVKAKDESVHPFGTHKDRRSALIVQKAVNSGVGTIALITAGNAGYSLAKYAEETSLRIVLIIDKHVRANIKSALKTTKAEIIELDLSSRELHPQDIVSLARRQMQEKVWDVSNGFEEAYEGIVEELYEEKPEGIVVPVGSGELFLGLHKGIQHYGLRTKLYGVSVESKQSKADKLYTAYLPAKERIETTLREGHRLILLSESEVERSIEHAPQDLMAEPSALVVFAALQQVKQECADAMVVNTGRGNL